MVFFEVFLTRNEKGTPLNSHHPIFSLLADGELGWQLRNENGAQRLSLWCLLEPHGSWGGSEVRLVLEKKIFLISFIFSLSNFFPWNDFHFVFSVCIFLLFLTHSLSDPPLFLFLTHSLLSLPFFLFPTHSLSIPPFSSFRHLLLPRKTITTRNPG